MTTPLAVFQLPVAFDLVATFFFALTGCLAAIRRNYDIVGVFALSGVCAVGGSVLRDGVFLQTDLPAVVKDPRYLYAILIALAIGPLAAMKVQRFGRFLAYLDAVGLAAYAIFGTQKSLAMGISPWVAVIIGAINACGGGLIRDVITREEPLVFKPGQFYVLAALFGAITFVLLVQFTSMEPLWSGVIACSLCFLFRVLAIRFNWKTRSFYALKAPSEEHHGSGI
jgi:uncharacterized membrane protein YeiH